MQLPLDFLQLMSYIVIIDRDEPGLPAKGAKTPTEAGKTGPESPAKAKKREARERNKLC
jgi:hypothetical protein